MYISLAQVTTIRRSTRETPSTAPLAGRQDDTDRPGVNLSTGTVVGIGVSILFGIAMIVFLVLIIFYYRRKALGIAKKQILATSASAAGAEVLSNIQSNTVELSPWSPFSDKSQPQQQKYQELETPTSIPLYELSTGTELPPVEMEAPGVIHEAPSLAPKDSWGRYR
ncbi:hypothetical protein MGN70_003162 [Eutypa lata]|nr:hypothetical protein MGN70_003162 [Eutypa lata]